MRLHKGIYKLQTGLKVDVKKIVKEAKENGSYVLLDVIQSAGAVRINAKELDVDFIVAGSYKWLMSPQGSGFLYIKKGLIEDPPFYGWKSSKNYLEFNSNEFILEEGPRRFEIGTIDMSATLALAKSCEILSENMDLVESSVLTLSAITIKLAEEHGFEVITPKDRRAGIIILKVNKAREIVNSLINENIVVSPRGEGIRISTHFYNTKDEINNVIERISYYNKKFNS
ncbi:hypothetical protein DJ531_10355 [Sulfolobus sp. A20-N-F6]|nr:hypothetical protein DJ531_10355 [Sulfolobus sp. A20-N-F6]